MKLCDFKGEEAFKVMGKTISVLKRIFLNKKASEIIDKKSKGYLMEFFEFSLTEQSKEWLELFTILNPDKAPEEVSTQDVIAFAYDFINDEQLMSLFFSQSRTTKLKTSIGSAMENTEV